VWILILPVIDFGEVEIEPDNSAQSYQQPWTTTQVLVIIATLEIDVCLMRTVMKERVVAFQACRDLGLVMTASPVDWKNSAT
jgi:hypothetical protein